MSAPAHPESDPGSVAARTRRPSWPQAPHSPQTTSEPRPIPQQTGPAESVHAPLPAFHLAAGPGDDIYAPSWHPSPTWTPQSLGFPLSLSSQTNSEPACLLPLRLRYAEPEYAWSNCRWIGNFVCRRSVVLIVARQ